ncbi:MAG: thiamine pyrophosphate-binding protein [Candidatus Woesearchaeota archaeon]
MKTHEKNEYTGADILVKSLKDLGVKRVFGYTGGAILPVFESMRKEGIETIINTNEQAATFSAAGQSRSSDEVGVVVVTSGPSVTNTLTAVMDSYTDSIPLLVISGQVPTHKLGTDAFQHTDVSKIFDVVSKKTMLIDNESGIEKKVKDAYVYAKSGKPGPVVLDFLLDKQNSKATFESTSISSFERKYHDRRHISEAQCKDFFKLLQEAEKPLLYVGGGLNSTRGSQAINEFNALFDIPWVNTLMAKGVMDDTHALSMGMLGMYGTPYANTVIQETDFFFAIGCRWDDRVAEKVGEFGPNAKIAYIDINPGKVQQIIEERGIEFSCIGDGVTVLQDLVHYAKKHAISFDITDWQRNVTEIKKHMPLKYNTRSDWLQQAQVLAMLNEYIDADDIVTTGVGNHQMLAAHYIQRSKPKTFLTSGSSGTMGFGLPAAIGASYANPHVDVYDIDGDGSLSMNLGELMTVARSNLPVKIVVMNNNGDGMVRCLQKYKYGNSMGTTREAEEDFVTKNPSISYSGLARECNFDYTMKVSTVEELRQSLDAMKLVKGSCLLEVMVDPDEDVWPKIRSGKSYHDMELGPYIKDFRA